LKAKRAVVCRIFLVSFASLRFAVFALMLAMLAACGSANNIALSQTYSASGLIFNYPAGWKVNDSTSAVLIANTQAALDAMQISSGSFNLQSGQVGASLVMLPMSQLKSLGADVTPVEVLKQIKAPASVGQFGDASATTIGSSKSAARAAGSNATTDLLMVAVKIGENGYALVIAASAKGELSHYEPTLDAILDTIRYTPESP
jgi:hypothetical protein